MGNIYFWALWLLFICLSSIELILAFIKFIFVGFSIESINFTTLQQIRICISFFSLILALLAGWIYIKLSKRNRIAIEKLQLQNKLNRKSYILI